MKLVVMGHKNMSVQPINIPIVEQQYGAMFIGDFCLKTRDGYWSDIPVAIFYQPNPNIELGHTHYFGIFATNYNQLMITNGESAFEEPITGIVADNGEVIFSRYRHDYRTSQDGSVFIDGGRDYVRYGGNIKKENRLVQLIIDKDKLIISNSITPQGI